MTLYSVTGHCGTTHIRIEFRWLSEAIVFMRHKIDEGWTMQDPVPVQAAPSYRPAIISTKARLAA